LKHIILLLALLFSALGTQAAVRGEEIHYRVEGKPYTGYLAYDDAISGKRPGVLVVHEWWGYNAYARKRADMLAALGYTALAIDMYGTGKQADHPEDAKKFMQAVINNMPEAEKRFNVAKAILARHKTVDKDRIAAIGYCFGGGIVLHMARIGTDMDGVVSFHGMLGTQQAASPGVIKAKVRVFTGAADPFSPPEVVASFEKEMRSAGADFQVTRYPGVKHSFTNPEANAFAKRFNMPLAYDKAADTDSWQRMQAFFLEIFKVRQR